MPETAAWAEADVQRAQGCANAVSASLRSRRIHPPLFAVCCLDIFPAENLFLVKHIIEKLLTKTHVGAIDILINIQVK